MNIDRIKYLISLLNEASDTYYNTDAPMMSDKQYDNMFDELKKLETEIGCVYTNSPTQKVGYGVKNKLEKATHNTKMLSLDKTKEISVLKKFLGSEDAVLSWKLDGLTIVLTYDNGTLTNAATRGNGEVGSNILHNAKVFKAGIPLTINYKGHLVVRGEGLISKEDFNKINIDGVYANPRNLTSGSIMSLDSKTTKERCLQFIAFNIAECDIDFKYYSKQLEWLKEIGFNPVQNSIVDRSNIEQNINHIKSTMLDRYGFATDGLVLKYDDLKYGESLGATSHHELSGLAYKWTDTTAETTLKDIQFQVGRTGVLTPVAIFDEVEIEGSMVGKASVHNVSILKALELGIGDTIEVYKANMIIPQIDENLTRSNTFELPNTCPVCGGEVEILSTGNADFLMCMNPDCKAKLIQKISHFVGRDAMNVMGLSEATIEKFIEEGFIDTAADLFRLDRHKNDIINKDGFGIKSYNNMQESIQTSKKCKLEQFLFALGIPNVGKGTSKDLAKSYKTIEGLKTFKYNDYVNIKDIGGITADSIIEWINNEDNIKLLDELLTYVEIETDKPKEVSSNGIFSGKKLYCTGTFANYKKDELRSIVEDNGGEFTSGYAKSLNYLVVGSLKGSSKEAKALKDGINVLSELEFVEMIKG